MPPVELLLLDIAIIVLSARLAGGMLRRLGQPPVVGEILAGLLLGPTFLGHLVGHQLFPEAVLPSLTTLAEVGLVLFMFTVGMELDRTLVRGLGRAASGVAAGATALPFVLGCLLALALVSRHAHGSRIAFVLFIGTAVSATAFPVLARVLTDRDLHRTTLGGLALSSAALIDVAAWALLGVVVTIARAGNRGFWHLLLVPVYLLLMAVVVRPLLRRLVATVQRAGQLTAEPLSYVLIGLMLSAWAAQWLQIHFIFGAFLYGTLMPRADGLTGRILERIQQLTTLLLLPIFFVVTGLTVDLLALPASGLAVLAGILGVSIGGKLIGGYAGARLAGVPRRSAAALATLVNTRGLTEIIILSVGAQEHVLDPELYALMLIMALVTTAMTGPLLTWCRPRSWNLEPVTAAAERTRVGAAS